MLISVEGTTEKSVGQVYIFGGAPIEVEIIGDNLE